MPAHSGAGIPIAGVILAGGRSRRMGGAVKALLPLAGKPLLQHVIDRVQPQVGELYLSVERASEPLAVFGLRQVEDPRTDAGPLAGLMRGLQNMSVNYDWLMLAPCDAPFVPRDQGRRLLECALDSGLPGAFARYGAEPQPTFSIWHRGLLPRMERAVTREHMAGLKQFLRLENLAVLDWPAAKVSPFFNINDPETLSEAERLLRSEPAMEKSCSA